MSTKDFDFKRATRAQVAKLAGVSTATVSYVVNNSPKPIAEETRQRVLKAVKELGYTPHAIARSLKTGNTGTVGLVVPIISSPGMAFMASMVQDGLMSYGYRVIMANTHENSEIERKMIELLVAQYVEGVIACPASRFHKKQFEQFSKTGIPLIFMDRYVNGIRSDTVITNNVKAGRKGTELLIRQGCRQIVCLSYNGLASSAFERVAGYRSALKAAGIPVDEKSILYFNEPSTIPISFRQYLDRFGVPDGVLCTNQDVGIEFVKMVSQQKIPISNRNIAVFDADWGPLLTPPIAVVRQNFQEVARTAVELLISRIRGEKTKPRFIRIDADLIA